MAVVDACYFSVVVVLPPATGLLPSMPENVLRWKCLFSGSASWLDRGPGKFDLNIPLGGTVQSTQSTGRETIRVLVADDTRIHTELLADVLRRDPQLEVISPPLRSRDLVATVRLQRVNVVILSSNLDEEPLTGFEVLRQLRASDPGIFTIMLLDSSKKETILEAFHAGARGVFGRHDSVESLSKCVRCVYEGQIWANSQQMSFAVEALASSPVVRAVDANGFSLLSKREMDVVRSLAEGLSNREIAERLGLSQHTIKNYLFRVYDKLGASSRLELLFMTLTQARVPQAMAGVAPNASPNRDRDPRQAKSGTVAGGTHSQQMSSDPEEPELRYPPASAVRRKEVKLEKQNEESVNRGTKQLMP